MTSIIGTSVTNHNPYAASASVVASTLTGQVIGSTISTTSIMSGTLAAGQTRHIPLVARGSNGQPLVSLHADGSVVWADGIHVNEAAEAFSNALTLGAELSAGITHKAKQNMRDLVFNELIEIARIKGHITAEDLTYYLKAAKIMDKLKGLCD